jgi:hypothetical protein
LEVFLKWSVRLCPEFAAEFRTYDERFREELISQMEVLEALGPMLGRPRVDTLNGSRYCNMKELRFRFGEGVWRVAFAFDPSRCAVLLVAGDKAGVGQGRFYQKLIAQADERFGRYLSGEV